MKVQNFGNMCRIVELESDELTQLQLAVVALDDEHINNENDLIAWALCQCMDNWPDVLEDRLLRDPEYPTKDIDDKLAVLDPTLVEKFTRKKVEVIDGNTCNTKDSQV